MWPPRDYPSPSSVMSGSTAAAELAALAVQLPRAERGLALRYLKNARDSEARRTINAHNKHFAGLGSVARSLLQLAGFQPSKDRYVLKVPPSELAYAIDILESCEVSLLALPNDVLHRILARLPAEDLSCMQRVSTGVASIASAGILWLPLCPPKFWKHGLNSFDIEQWVAAAPIGAAPSSIAFLFDHGAGHVDATRRALQQAELANAMRVSWRHVFRIAFLWERLRARSSHNFSLRDGLPLEALTHAPQSLVGRLPPSLVASLVVHDGQLDGPDGVGLFFAGARLLSLDEMVEAVAATPAPTDLIPLSTVVGFQQLAVRLSDGAVVLAAGFNCHVKALDWASFLERVLYDTV